MIKTFKSSGLLELWQNGTTAQIDQRMHRRLLQRLELLNKIRLLRDIPPQWDCHPPHKGAPTLQIDVNGPWRLTFRWIDGDVFDVDFGQPH